MKLDCQHFGDRTCLEKLLKITLRPLEKELNQIQSVILDAQTSTSSAHILFTSHKQRPDLSMISLMVCQSHHKCSTGCFTMQYKENGFSHMHLFVQPGQVLLHSHPCCLTAPFSRQRFKQTIRSLTSRKHNSSVKPVLWC